MAASKTTVNPWRARLVAAGIRNLKEFGYPSVNETNIVTDYVFKAMFKSMLEDNKGKADRTADAAIAALIVEIDAAKAAP